MAEPAPNRVRRVREERGLSQVALAEQVRLTRQSIGSIEAGKSVPSVDVAVRIARALECRVEDLFGGDEGNPRVEAEPAGAAAGRVALAHVGGRWVALPLAADGLRVSADGIVVEAGTAKALVEPVRPLEEARQNVVVTGCATALGLLTDRLSSRAGAGRYLWFSASSTAALDALERERTHVAGVHLVDPKTGEPDVAEIRRAASKHALVVVTLARWEAGLLTRPEDCRRIRAVADLGRPGLRLVRRERGAGAQRLLERELREAGLSSSLARDAALEAKGHLDVARAIAMGAADAGIATRDVAMASGLAFVPLAEERYDLVVPRSSMTDPRIERLFDVLVSAPVRRELASLGYDVAPAGERVAEVNAA